MNTLRLLAAARRSAPALCARSPGLSATCRTASLDVRPSTWYRTFIFGSGGSEETEVLKKNIEDHERECKEQRVTIGDLQKELQQVRTELSVLKSRAAGLQAQAKDAEAQKKQQLGVNMEQYNLTARQLQVARKQLQAITDLVSTAQREGAGRAAEHLPGPRERAGGSAQVAHAARGQPDREAAAAGAEEATRAPDRKPRSITRRPYSLSFNRSNDPSTLETPFSLGGKEFTMPKLLRYLVYLLRNPQPQHLGKSDHAILLDLLAYHPAAKTKLGVDAGKQAEGWPRFKVMYPAHKDEIAEIRANSDVPLPSTFLEEHFTSTDHSNVVGLEANPPVPFRRGIENAFALLRSDGTADFFSWRKSAKAIHSKLIEQIDKHSPKGSKGSNRKFHSGVSSKKSAKVESKGTEDENESDKGVTKL